MDTLFVVLFLLWVFVAVMTFMEDDFVHPIPRMVVSILWPVVLPVLGFYLVGSFVFSRRRNGRKRKGRLDFF